jgi:hypothetical protein
MGTTTIIVSVGGFQERDLIMEPFPSGKSHWRLGDLSTARDGWEGPPTDSFLYGGVVSDLVWADVATWLESQEWNDPGVIEVLVRDEYADWFEVWRMTPEQRLVQVLSGQNPESGGTEGFRSFEDSSSWTLGPFGSAAAETPEADPEP